MNVNVRSWLEVSLLATAEFSSSKHALYSRVLQNALASHSADSHIRFLFHPTKSPNQVSVPVPLPSFTFSSLSVLYPILLFQCMLHMNFHTAHSRGRAQTVDRDGVGTCVGKARARRPVGCVGVSGGLTPRVAGAHWSVGHRARTRAARACCGSEYC